MTARDGPALSANRRWDDGMTNQEQEVTPFGFRHSGPAGRKCRAVYIVDDDPGVCHALTILLENADYAVESFSSAQSLLAALNEKTTGILILDLFLADMSGLALQAELRNRGIGLKTIFISGHGDIEKSVQAIKGGAIDFIEKPYTGKLLLSVVEEALRLVNAEAMKRRLQDTLDNRCERLTPREREIMHFLIRGDSSRKLAERLGLSSRTVEIHRSKIMHKLEVASLPDLVRLVYMNGNSQPEEVLMDIRQSLYLQDDQKTG
jgi:two-component system response regulator FixJ